MKTPLLLIILTIAVRWKVDGSTFVIARFNYNKTSAHCYDPAEDLTVDISKEWDVKKGFRYSNSYCYDKDGMGYKYNYYVDDCCECMKYRCQYSTRRNEFGSTVYYMYWLLYSIASSCCQDCQGTIYPPNQVVGVTVLEDKCATEITSICKHNDALSRYNGLITKTHSIRGCCSDESGLSEVGTEKLDPTTCSQKYCSPGNPSFWVESPLFPGECNCCEFDNTLVVDGGVVNVGPGLNYTCCDGKMVMDYNQELPTNCSDPKAVHRSLAFSVDNTGSVSNYASGIKNLTNSLITGTKERGYTIPMWILTTFNDINENIEDNSELVIETTNSELMRDALNDIIYSGGGDGAERALQGLLLTLNRIDQNTMIIVFTDHPSKNLELEDQLINLRDKKMANIYFVLAPKYNGKVGDASWKVFDNLSKGKIYNMEKLDRTAFLDQILLKIRDDCELSTLEEALESLKPKPNMSQSAPATKKPKT